MSNAYRYTEAFFRRYEPLLLTAFTHKIDEWAGSDPNVDIATCRVNLTFAINSFLDNRWPSELNYDEVKDRFSRYCLIVLGHSLVERRVVVWKPRTGRSRGFSRTDHSPDQLQTLPRPDNFSADRQRIDELMLPASDKNIFRAALRACHYGFQTQMIFLHGEIEPWMAEELAQLRSEVGETFVEYNPGPDALGPRVIIN